MGVEGIGMVSNNREAVRLMSSLKGKFPKMRKSERGGVCTKKRSVRGKILLDRIRKRIRNDEMGSRKWKGDYIKEREKRKSSSKGGVYSPI